MVDFTQYQSLLTSGSDVGKLDEAEEIKKIVLADVPDAHIQKLKYTKCLDQLSIKLPMLMEKAFGDIKKCTSTIVPTISSPLGSVGHQQTDPVELYKNPADISRFQMKNGSHFQSFTPISNDRAWVVNVDFRECSTFTKACSLIDNAGQVHNN